MQFFYLGLVKSLQSVKLALTISGENSAKKMPTVVRLYFYKSCDHESQPLSLLHDQS